MTRDEARKAVIKINEEGTPGKLSTGMCAALGISFESFLIFTQRSHEDQLTIIQDLATFCAMSNITDKLGHCGQ